MVKEEVKEVVGNIGFVREEVGIERFRKKVEEIRVVVGEIWRSK